jgi:hypothetical protein
MLTAQPSARLNWLYRLGDLHVRIPEDTQIEVGVIIDDAYENWRKNATRDESRTSAPMTEAMKATEGHFPSLSMK